MVRMTSPEGECCPVCNYKRVVRDTDKMLVLGEEFCGNPNCKCHKGECCPICDQRNFDNCEGCINLDCPCHRGEKGTKIGDDTSRYAGGTGLGEIRTDGTTPSNWEEELANLINRAAESVKNAKYPKETGYEYLHAFFTQTLTRERERWEKEERDNDLTYLKENAAKYEDGQKDARKHFLILIEAEMLPTDVITPRGALAAINQENELWNKCLATLKSKLMEG